MAQNDETPRASATFDSPQTTPSATSPVQEDDIPTLFSKFTKITQQLASVFKRHNIVDSNTAEEEAFGTANAPNPVTTIVEPENPGTNQPPSHTTVASNLLPVLNNVNVPHVHGPNIPDTNVPGPNVSVPNNQVPVINNVTVPHVQCPNFPVPNVQVPIDTQTAAIAILSKQQDWPKFTGTSEDFKGWKNTFISAVSTSELKCLYDEASFELVGTCDSQTDRLLYSKLVSSLPANDFFRSEDELRGRGLALWKALIDKYEPKDTPLVVQRLQSHFFGDLARETNEDLDNYYRRFHDIANRINRVYPNSIEARNIRTRFLVTLGPNYEFFKEQIAHGTLDEKWFNLSGPDLKDALRAIQANRAALQHTPSMPNSATTIGAYTGHNFTANAMRTGASN